jgi:tetratricopeptide (TPR) repeat protein
MSSWVGWLLLMGAAWLVFALLRGPAEFVASRFDQYFLEPRRERRRRRERESPHAETTKKPAGRTKLPPAVPIAVTSQVHKRSRLVTLWKRLSLSLTKKTYDYWVGCAITETDPELKIEYLTKALQLDPTYTPAWGLKANALCAVARYAEAIDCFEHSLKAHPCPSNWYHKGTCYYQLKRYGDAIACFKEALKMHPGKSERQVVEDSLRMKSQAEAELRKATAT